MKKNTRPNIPLRTQLQLWTVAGGRCEFFGCNKILWRDNLTFTEGNYANIAHIVSWTPSGPRGDLRISKKLSKNISNLMLMCRNHAHLIDRKENLKKFPITLLQKYKRNHEDRIRIQTSIKEEMKTTIVRFQCNIRGRHVEVPFTDTYSAIIAAGRYPADEKGILIDLSNLEYSKENSFWDTARRQIDLTIERGLSSGNNNEKPTHLSIFGLAPIPLLVYLGFKLGNAIPVDLYLRPHRNTGKWMWNEKVKKKSAKLKILRRNFAKKAKKVALVLSLSGTAQPNTDLKHVPTFEIRVSRPDVDSLASQIDVELFRKLYRNTLTDIREKYGRGVEIHLFAAVPPAAAVICGKEFMHETDPSLFLYEHSNEKVGFNLVLKINKS